MNTITTFRIDIIKWLAKNNISNIDIQIADQFAYNPEERTIYFGVYDDKETGLEFAQYIYEYGCEYVDIWYPILAFLHEVGHVRTLDNFDEKDRFYYQIIKSFKTTNFDYWNVPDEFAANMFVIDFINNNVDALNELIEIIMVDLSAIYCTNYKESVIEL